MNVQKRIRDTIIDCTVPHFESRGKIWINSKTYYPIKILLEDDLDNSTTITIDSIEPLGFVHQYDEYIIEWLGDNRSYVNKYFKYYNWIIISMIGLWYALRQFNCTEFIDALSDVNYWYLVGAMVITTCSCLVSCSKMEVAT